MLGRKYMDNHGAAVAESSNHSSQTKFQVGQSTASKQQYSELRRQQSQPPKEMLNFAEVRSKLKEKKQQANAIKHLAANFKKLRNQHIISQQKLDN